jgi:putative flippase GtrA
MASPGSVTAQHFWRYCVVGGLAALLHFVVLIGLVEGANVIPIKASIIGFCMAVVLNYVLQYYWTFAANGSHTQKFIRFALIAVFALLINTGIFWLCNAVAALPYLLSQVAATGMVVVINFQLNRRYVFSEEPAR